MNIVDLAQCYLCFLNCILSNNINELCYRLHELRSCSSYECIICIYFHLRICVYLRSLSAAYCTPYCGDTLLLHLCMSFSKKDIVPLFCFLKSSHYIQQNKQHICAQVRILALEYYLGHNTSLLHSSYADNICKSELFTVSYGVKHWRPEKACLPIAVRLRANK